jgi:nucleotide-binding universal stress UspA family protein
VLLCYDGSSEAQQAIAAAGRLLPGGDALVLHVSKSYIDWSLGPSLGPLLEIPGVPEAIIEQAEAVLAEGVEHAREAGFAARGILRTTGRAVWRSVLDVASEHDVELIVAGTHGRRLRDRLGLGGVAQGLVSHSPVPVLITHGDERVVAHGAGTHLRAVLGFDGSSAATAAAEELCRRVPGVDTTVVTAWDTPGQLGAVFMNDVFVTQLATLSVELRAEARRIADVGAAIVREHGGTATSSARPSDQGIGTTLIAVARDIDADVIAVGAHGHHFASRALLGSVASFVVQRADRPVLVVPAAVDAEVRTAAHLTETMRSGT